MNPLAWIRRFPRASTQPLRRGGGVPVSDESRIERVRLRGDAG